VEARFDLGIRTDSHAGCHPAPRGLDQRAIAQCLPRDPELLSFIGHGRL
jgi:hypothetical protein